MEYVSLYKISYVDYQACTEMYLPTGFYGMPRDMFPPAPWDLSEFEKMCRASEGVSPRSRWAYQQWGGPVMTSQVSNIIYSSGYLDPWGAGGVLPNAKLGHNSISLWIEHGAHHVDIRSPAPEDPQSIVNARNIEIEYVSKWILEYWANM